MGNIKSFCCRDSLSGDDEHDERVRIIDDQYPSTNSLYNNDSNSGQDAMSYGSLNNGAGSGKTVEQSALDRIYQKMAANVIDVAPGESMIIQPAELVERQKIYQAKLNQIKTQLPLKSSNARVAKHIGGSTIDTTTRLNTSVASVGGSNWTKVGHQLNHTSATTNSGQNSSSNITIATATSSNSPQHMSKSQDMRRVEYEPISSEDLQLINSISERTVQAVKGLKITSQEQVITHFQP